MSVTMHPGDCRAVLATLPDASVQCCVTSPPYFGLRDYGTAQWEGGDAGCDHTRGLVPVAADDPGIRCSTLDGGKRTTTAQAEARSYRDTCGKCGARRIDAQIGLEPSPDAYVAELVAVFREVRRVLADSGCVFLNLGDSYAAGGAKTLGRNDAGRNFTGGGGNHLGSGNPGQQGAVTIAYGAKPKDLLMIPARVALALQADGWWLRSDIIWAKPNPMPESCRDRPTSAHEHVFLLSKRERYFYDADAVVTASVSRHIGETPTIGGAKGRDYKPQRGDPNFRNGAEQSGRTVEVAATANLRNVWTIATQPYNGAHFATMPPELAERCIKAGTSERGQCPHCAAPWARVVETPPVPDDQKNKPKSYDWHPTTKGLGGQKAQDWRNANPSRTTGWQPTCSCPEHKPVPQTVLDCFAGAGTTGLVADRLGRNAVLIELNPAYAGMARDRITDDAPLFANVALAEAAD